MNIDPYIIDNYKKFALVKTENIEAKAMDGEVECIEYSIWEIETRGYVILENFEEARNIISGWLNMGIEVFKSNEDFNAKYPPISLEERLARSRIFWWESIPKEQWTQELRDYFENDAFWQAFKSKNNLPDR